MYLQFNIVIINIQTMKLTWVFVHKTKRKQNIHTKGTCTQKLLHKNTSVS